MPRPLSFSQLRLTWIDELRHLAEQMQAVSRRLGTPAERSDDLAAARQIGARVKTLQLALAGLAALNEKPEDRPPRSVRSKPAVLTSARVLERHIA